MDSGYPKESSSKKKKWSILPTPPPVLFVKTVLILSSSSFCINVGNCQQSKLDTELKSEADDYEN